MTEIAIDLLTDNVSTIYHTNVLRKNENLVTKLVVSIPSDLLANQYKIVFKLPTAQYVTTADLTLNIDKIEYVIGDDLTAVTGTLQFEIHAYNVSELLYKSQIYSLEIKDTLN